MVKRKRGYKCICCGKPIVIRYTNHARCSRCSLHHKKIMSELVLYRRGYLKMKGILSSLRATGVIK